MNDKELINQIQLLGQIKPRQDWVVSVKTQILQDEIESSVSVTQVFSRMFLQLRPAFISLVVLVVIIGTFGFVQDSLPGDFLYPVKKVAEQGQAKFLVSEQDVVHYKLEMANKRLVELTKIAEVNQVKKLAPAIAEFQANVADAANNLIKAKDLNIKEIVAETQKLEENKAKVQALGIVIGETKDFNDAMKQLVERELESVQEQVLTESQDQALIQIRQDYEVGNYSQALEGILFLSYSE